MVSRRNFFSITIMMLTLLLMFQLTQVYYENIAETDKNIYSSNQVTSGANEWKPEAIDTNDPILETQYVLFFGDKDGAIGHTVQQWCNYTKRNLTVCSDPSSFTGKIGTNQEYVLVESAQMDVQNDLDKLEAFGFHTQAIDGHDFQAIEAALETAKTVKGRPCAIVMKTVKGKGVSFMENNAGWHGVAPNDAQYEQAMNELKAQLCELEGK